MLDYNTTQKHLNRKNPIFSLLDDAYIFYEINPFYRKQLKQLNLRECNEKKKTFINSSFFHQQMEMGKILGTKIKSKKKKENLRLILKQTTFNRIGNRHKKTSRENI